MTPSALADGAVMDYVLAMHPGAPVFPLAVPNEVVFMQGVFQELWGLFGVLALVLATAYLAHSKASRWPLWAVAPTRKPSDPATERTVRHLAVIMDGNRRYGRSKYGVTTKGHWDGGQTLSNFIDWCMEANIEILTVYAFSTENWSRSAAEIEALMTIFEHFSLKIQRTALEKDIRVSFLSTTLAPIPLHIRTLMQTIEDVTRRGAKFRLNVCLSYGGRGEIVNACRSIAERVAKGELRPEEIDESMFADQLLTAGQPDPDLVLRTSGECRISNYLLYQLAYSELAFLDKPWPAVTQDDLQILLEQYTKRGRRFGK